MIKAIIFDYNGVLNTGADIKETILKLSQDYKLFIASSTDLSHIQGFLANQGLLQCFVEIIGYNPSLNKFDKFKSIFKDYSLNPREVIFITDTQGDILQARQAGLEHIIGLLGGWLNQKNLVKANPEMIVENFNGLYLKIKNWKS